MSIDFPKKFTLRYAVGTAPAKVIRGKGNPPKVVEYKLVKTIGELCQYKKT
jgi:hypothetical protein